MNNIIRAAYNMFKPWDNYKKNNDDEKELLKRFNKFYLDNKNLSILKCKISDNKIVYRQIKRRKKLKGKIIYVEEKRQNYALLIFKEALKYSKRIGINIPDMDIYLSLQDHHFTDLDLPLFCYVKKETDKGILVPDWTFYKSYKSEYSNWNSYLKKIIPTCKKVKKKKNIIYFRGRNTSTDTNIRKNLYRLSKDDKRFKIVIKRDLIPVTEWCNYKYLIDIPGSHPWSVRFKELFMMNSLVIKIDTNDRWINFYNILFKPNVDYIRLYTDTYSGDYNIKTIKNIEKISDVKTKKIISKLINIYKYFNKNKNKYNKIVSNGNYKIKLITNKFIYLYIIFTLLTYYKKFYSNVNIKKYNIIKNIKIVISNLKQIKIKNTKLDNNDLFIK